MPVLMFTSTRCNARHEVNKHDHPNRHVDILHVMYSTGQGFWIGTILAALYFSAPFAMTSPRVHRVCEVIASVIQPASRVGN